MQSKFSTYINETDCNIIIIIIRSNVSKDKEEYQIKGRHRIFTTTAFIIGTATMIDKNKVLIIFLITVVSVSAECPPERKNKERSWEIKLTKDIKCNVSEMAGELLRFNDTKVYVNVTFMIKSFSFDEVDGIFTITAWIISKWTHPLLNWSPDNYGGIKEVPIKVGVMWTPVISIVNNADSDEFYDDYDTQCNVNHNGTITCIPHVAINVFCDSKIKNFPYDVQNCTVKFGPHNNYADRVVYSFSSKRKVSMMAAEESADWSIIDYDAGNVPNEPGKLYLSFLIERHAEVLAATLVYPTLIVIALTFVALAMTIENFNRVGLLMFNILCHFEFLNEIDYVIPVNGAEIPGILIFLRNSMILNVIVFGATFLLDHFRRRKEPSPQWIFIINKFFLGNKYSNFLVKHLISRSDSKILDSESESDADSANNQWIIFTEILNFLCFITTFMIYLILFVAHLSFLLQTPDYYAKYYNY